jgi:hypothetical protein
MKRAVSFFGTSFTNLVSEFQKRELVEGWLYMSLLFQEWISFMYIEVSHASEDIVWFHLPNFTEHAEMSWNFKTKRLCMIVLTLVLWTPQMCSSVLVFNFSEFSKWRQREVRLHFNIPGFCSRQVAWFELGCQKVGRERHLVPRQAVWREQASSLAKAWCCCVATLVPSLLKEKIRSEFCNTFENI